jgi:HEAT repeat protein
LTAPFALTSTTAGVVTLVSFLFAAACCAAMLVLYVRRRVAERRLRAERAGDIDLARRLMATPDLTDSDSLQRQFGDLEDDRKIRVFSHLLQLVRGDDHARLMRLAGRLGTPDRAIRRLTGGSAARRVDAVRMVEQFPLPGAIAALRHCLLHDSHREVRLEAAAALSRLGEVPSPRLLLDTLDLRHQPVNRLQRAILRVAAPGHAPELKELSMDPASAGVRPALVEALGWSEDFSMLATIGEHAADPDPEVRAAASKAARKLGHPGAAKWLLPLLLDPFDQVRIQAARAAGALGLVDSVPALAALSDSPSWWVRMRAAEALSVLRPEPSAAGRTGVRR